MNDNDRVLIHIPSDGEYIEILGYRIDGFDSFEAFCEHLKKFAEMEKTINRQNAEIERLKKDNEYILMQHAFQRRPSGDCWNDVIEKAKAEAVKEFAERLKQSAFDCDVSFGYGKEHYTEAVAVIEIDNLEKEFTEGEK